MLFFIGYKIPKTFLLIHLIGGIIVYGSADTETLLKSLCNEAEKDAKPFEMLGVTFDKSKYCTCVQSPDACAELETPPYDFVETCNQLILPGIPDSFKTMVKCECGVFKQTCAWFEKINADAGGAAGGGGGDGGDRSTGATMKTSTIIKVLPATSQAGIKPTTSFVAPPKPSSTPAVKSSVKLTTTTTTIIKPTPSSTKDAVKTTANAGGENNGGDNQGKDDKNTNSATNNNKNLFLVLFVSVAVILISSILISV